MTGQDRADELDDIVADQTGNDGRSSNGTDNLDHDTQRRFLERERAEHWRIEEAYVRQVTRLVLENRDLRAEIERLQQRTPTVRIDVGHETAMAKLRDINASLDRIDTLLGKERNDKTEP